VTPITKDAIQEAMAAAEEAIGQDLRGMYPMACRTLATTTQVLRDKLAKADAVILQAQLAIKATNSAREYATQYRNTPTAAEEIAEADHAAILARGNALAAIEQYQKGEEV